MDVLSIHNDSGLDTRDNRRVLLFKFVSIVGSVLLFIFAITDLVNEIYWLSGALFFVMPVLSINLAHFYQPANIDRAVYLISGIYVFVFFDASRHGREK